MSGSGRGRIAVLGGLTAIGSLGIQMVVPALPQIAADLSAGRRATGLIVGVYLFGLAVSQLLWGPVVDAAGRRPVLIGGAIGFALASLGASIAPDVVSLLAMRAAQAIAAAAMLVAARAIVTDGAGPDRGAGGMAYLMAITMLSPVLAPVAGGVIALTAGWRTIFAALTAAAAAGGACAWAGVRETMQTRHPLSIGSAVGGWGALAVNGPFRRYALLAGLTSGGLYSFLTLSPFLYTVHHHLPLRLLGLQYGIVAMGAAAGALLAGRSTARHSPDAVLRYGTVVQIIGAGLAMIALALDPSAAALTASMTVYALASGLIAPTALVGAVAAAGGRRGTAASAYGATQMAAGAATSFLVLALPSGSAALGITLMTFAASSTIVAWR